jgi:hypothetical protein
LSRSIQPRYIIYLVIITRSWFPYTYCYRKFIFIKQVRYLQSVFFQIRLDIHEYYSLMDFPRLLNGFHLMWKSNPMRQMFLGKICADRSSFMDLLYLHFQDFKRYRRDQSYPFHHPCFSQSKPSFSNLEKTPNLF